MRTHRSTATDDDAVCNSLIKLCRLTILVYTVAAAAAATAVSTGPRRRRVVQAA